MQKAEASATHCNQSLVDFCYAQPKTILLSLILPAFCVVVISIFYRKIYVKQCPFAPPHILFLRGTGWF